MHKTGVTSRSRHHLLMNCTDLVGKHQSDGVRVLPPYPLHCHRDVDVRHVVIAVTYLDKKFSSIFISCCLHQATMASSVEPIFHIRNMYVGEAYTELVSLVC